MTVFNRNNEKKICLCLHNEGFRIFLTALLREWGFLVRTECPPQEEELLLADGNCSSCCSHRKRVDLTASLHPDSDAVSLPIVVEHLWRVLEKNFHLPPRQYLRLAVDLPVSMTVRGEVHPGRLSSLSPAGGRLLLPRELAVGEHVPIVLPLTQQPLHLSGKVIYVSTFPDSDNRYDAGVLFDGIAAAEKDLLRDTIILIFFNRIRPHLPRWAFEVGISHFDLSPTLLNQL